MDQTWKIRCFFVLFYFFILFAALATLQKWKFCIWMLFFHSSMNDWIYCITLFILNHLWHDINISKLQVIPASVCSIYCMCVCAHCYYSDMMLTQPLLLLATPTTTTTTPCSTTDHSSQPLSHHLPPVTIQLTTRKGWPGLWKARLKADMETQKQSVRKLFFEAERWKVLSSLLMWKNMY